MRNKPCLKKWDRHIWKVLPNTRKLCQRPGCMKLNPLGVPPFVRFWDHVELQGKCWIYTGAKDIDGYGVWTIKDGGVKKNIRAHRYSFFLYHGYLPYGEEELDHTCDTRACINPDHLTAKTHQQNVSRMSKCYFSKLNQRSVEEIRKLISDGKNVSELAKLYKISEMSVYRIKSGITWKDR